MAQQQQQQQILEFTGHMSSIFQPGRLFTPFPVEVTGKHYGSRLAMLKMQAIHAIQL